MEELPRLQALTSIRFNVHRHASPVGRVEYLIIPNIVEPFPVAMRWI